MNTSIRAYLTLALVIFSVLPQVCPLAARAEQVVSNDLEVEYPSSSPLPAYPACLLLADKTYDTCIRAGQDPDVCQAALLFQQRYMCRCQLPSLFQPAYCGASSEAACERARLSCMINAEVSYVTCQQLNRNNCYQDYRDIVDVCTDTFKQCVTPQRKFISEAPFA